MATHQTRVMAGSLPRVVMAALIVAAVAPSMGQAQLSYDFYNSSCPNMESTVNSALQSALSSDGRVGASILRVHFHDCFVQGCDGSVLLDDTSTFTGEKTAKANANSLRGFDVIDDIKSSVESVCAATVSCADILAVVARDAVVAAGGPYWAVELGRRDSTTASLSDANNNLPKPTDDVASLTSTFSNQGLSEVDMVALAGAHTFGKAQCVSFSGRLFNFSGTGSPDPTIDPSYLAILQAQCPQGGSGITVENLDQGTPTTFDNSYYSNLLSNKGLLRSDQNLESEGGSTGSTVSTFGGSQSQFFSQFSASLIKMGRINPLTGSEGKIRTNCRVVN